MRRAISAAASSVAVPPREETRRTIYEPSTLQWFTATLQVIELPSLLASSLLSSYHGKPILSTRPTKRNASMHSNNDAAAATIKPFFVTPTIYCCLFEPLASQAPPRGPTLSPQRIQKTKSQQALTAHTHKAHFFDCFPASSLLFTLSSASHQIEPKMRITSALLITTAAQSRTAAREFSITVAPVFAGYSFASSLSPCNYSTLPALFSRILMACHDNFVSQKPAATSEPIETNRTHCHASSSRCHLF